MVLLGEFEAPPTSVDTTCYNCKCGKHNSHMITNNHTDKKALIPLVTIANAENAIHI
jgi:hypothetical protein